MSNSDSDIEDSNDDFGSVLAEARQSQDYTIEEISRHLKITVRTITAIEASDIDLLPASTFAQGYIRAYAKFLEISEEKVLDLYNQAVPHNRAEKLKSRSNLSNEANSQSPLIKTVTAFLLVAAIAALIYGSFQYCQEKANVMENELESTERSFTGNSLNSPGQNPVNIKQKARLTDEDELIAQDSDTIEPRQLMGDSERDESGLVASDIEISELNESDLNEAVVDSETDDVTASKAEAGAEVGVNELTSESSLSESNQRADEQLVNEQLVNEQLDVLKIYAKKGSWIQVHDANNARLLYNMLPVRGSKELRGHAPFRVSLGNAKTTSLVINDLAIDMSDYIRANNTARFTVSTKQQTVIFH